MLMDLEWLDHQAHETLYRNTTLVKEHFCLTAFSMICPNQSTETVAVDQHTEDQNTVSETKLINNNYHN